MPKPPLCPQDGEDARTGTACFSAICPSTEPQQDRSICRRQDTCGRSSSSSPKTGASMLDISTVGMRLCVPSERFKFGRPKKWQQPGARSKHMVMVMSVLLWYWVRVSKARPGIVIYNYFDKTSTSCASCGLQRLCKSHSQGSPTRTCGVARHGWLRSA